jgi:hypothetical protein
LEVQRVQALAYGVAQELLQASSICGHGNTAASTYCGQFVISALA